MDDHTRINLGVPQPTPALQLNRCIICQQKCKTTEKLYRGAIGRKRVREVAALKNDKVQKRLRLLGPDAEFKYHNTYSCYTSYTDIRNLPTISEEPVDEETTEISEETPHHISTRSSMIPRPGPSKCNDPDYTNCIICGSDRVWLKRKGTQLRDKFCLCTAESAKQFLKAMENRKDVVYTRCADLKDPDDVYAADLYCHNICFKQYVSMSHTK